MGDDDECGAGVAGGRVARSASSAARSVVANGEREREKQRLLVWWCSDGVPHALASTDQGRLMKQGDDRENRQGNNKHACETDPTAHQEDAGDGVKERPDSASITNCTVSCRPDCHTSAQQAAALSSPLQPTPAPTQFSAIAYPRS